MDIATLSNHISFPTRIADAVAEAETLLRGAHMTHTPRLEAEMLMAHVTGLGRARLIAAYSDPVDQKTYEHFLSFLLRRLRGEPMAYVVGVKDFMGHTFRVDRRALIPRPETETLVEHVLDLVGPDCPQHRMIADIGTGSGCIAISLALSLPDTRIHATDIAHDALELARENAELHGVADRVIFHVGDACSALPEFLRNSFDMIVSNPPYVADPEYAALDVGIRDFEPPSALKGGVDGLDTIRRITAQSTTYLKDEGMLALEIGETQAAEAAVLFERVGGLSSIQIFRDLAGRNRVILGRNTARA